MGYLDSSQRRYGRTLFAGFLPLLFLLASCSGGGGGSGGGGLGALSVELAFTPGDRTVEVDLVEKGPLVQLLNISTYQLTAIDSADETMRVEGDKLAEGDFNGSTLMGLTNDHNYTFSLRVFYFPILSAELSNLSLRIEYASANARNIRDAGGITVGSNLDGDYLANLVDADDDNDGLNDLDANGAVLDECPRGDIDWQRNETTDNDGDGCRDASEDRDDDNDGLLDGADSGTYMGRECRLFADCDNDGEGDESDIDVDGDGLIEIGMAAELDAVRHQLDGSGQQLSAGGALDRTGCGDGAAITECSGYELVRNISLVDYAAGEGWEPLGHDASADLACEEGDPFSGVFDGNGFTISDLNINRSDQHCIGFFAYTQNSVIRNLSVEAIAVRGISSIGVLIANTGSSVEVISSSVKVEEVRGSGDSVGGLIGGGSGVRITSSSVVVGEVRGNNDLGGLVGGGSLAEVVSSSVVVGKVRGNNNLGGLVGGGFGMEVISSSMEVGEVRGDGGSVGGLIGNGQNAEVVSSSSVAGTVHGGSDNVGGLVGDGQNAEINSSSSVAGVVIGQRLVGGLVGNGQNAEVVSSSSVAGTVNGSGLNVGGLVGGGRNAEVVSSSSVARVVIGDRIVGGLVGGGRNTKVISSFSVVEVMRGAETGGLVGSGNDAKVVSSFSVTGEIDADHNNLGGLVGEGDNVKVISSFSVTEAVRGLDFVGGLVGAGDGVEVVSSLMVAGEMRGRSEVDNLLSGEGDVIVSYWHTVVSDATNSKGEGKTLSELRTPTNDNAYDMGSIYANWTRGADIDGTAGVENITIWCDEDLSDEIEADEMRDGSGSGDDNRIWDFGGSDDYPAIRCAPLDLAEQRSWWFINTTEHPNLNRTRLDVLLP